MSQPVTAAMAFGTAAVGAAQGKADRDEHHTERQEGEIPDERGAKVVAYMVNVEQVMVDEALHQIEGAPSGEDDAEVRTPRRRELASLPRADDQQGRPP
jgi:hypothetical protein